MTDFIVVAISDNDNKYYIANTSPILWSSDIKDVKMFDSYNHAKNELEDHFIYLCSTIVHTGIRSIWIFEYYNNEEIGRTKYIW